MQNAHVGGIVVERIKALFADQTEHSDAVWVPFDAADRLQGLFRAEFANRER
jgi:hypothetical protein